MLYHIVLPTEQSAKNQNLQVVIFTLFCRMSWFIRYMSSCISVFAWIMLSSELSIYKESVNASLKNIAFSAYRLETSTI